MFEPSDRARDSQQPRAPDRPASAPPAAPNQPPRYAADTARSRKSPSARPKSGGPATPPPERSTSKTNSQARSELKRPEPPAPRIDDDEPPDANALIERLRRQRHQREAEQSATERARRPKQHTDGDSVVEQRFAAGDGIFCLPYGDGVVRASRIEGGQELLTVNFPAYGDLTIDPAKSLVRKLDQAAPEEDDLL